MIVPQRTPGSRWSKAELAYLAKRKEEGATNKDVAGEMGTTPKAIQDVQRSRGGMRNKTPKWTKAHDDELIDLRTAGYAWSEIGDKFHDRTSAQCAARYQRLLAAGKVPNVEGDVAMLCDVRAPNAEDARRAFDAEMLHAENEQRMRSHVRHVTDPVRNPPRNWSPGDPVTW